MGDELWTADHPVLAVLRARQASGSRPGARTDGCKVGLAVEGGGMRGVVSGGMLVALDDLGYTDAFDAMYGPRRVPPTRRTGWPVPAAAGITSRSTGTS